MITSFDFDLFGFSNNIHDHSLVKNYLNSKQDFTTHMNYYSTMNNEAKNFARSLKMLMEYYGDNQLSLAKKSGISQKTISNMLNPGDDRSPTLANVSLIANTYKIKTWRVIMPNICIDDLLKNQAIDNLSPEQQKQVAQYVAFIASQTPEITPETQNKPLTTTAENVGGGDL